MVAELIGQLGDFGLLVLAMVAMLFFMSLVAVVDIVTSNNNSQPSGTNLQHQSQILECRNCGTISENVKYCPECGNQLIL